jgi:hypothetical protein
MPITLLGSIGFGLVWGWLLGSLGGRVRRRFLVGWSASAATLLAALAVRWFVDWRALALFLGMSVLSLLLHLAWRNELLRRFGTGRIIFTR